MLIGSERIFVILGDECNLGCKYCCQHEIHHHVDVKNFNRNVVKWIDDVAGISEHIHVVFYGGEPLLQFPIIKRFVGFAEAENVSYGVITNGKLLTQEMVDFFNATGVTVAVSWDGHASKITRGYDVVEDKLDLLLQINDLSISGVISAYAMPRTMMREMQEVDDKYFPIHKKHIRVHFDSLFGVDIPDPHMRDYTPAFDEEVKSIINEYDEWLKSNDNSKMGDVLQQTMNRFVGRWWESKDGGMYGSIYCVNGYGVLNVDLEGNLYICHNTREKIGHIYGRTTEYLNEVMKRHKDEAEVQAMCEKCEIRKLCNIYCLVTPLDKADTWCASRKRFYTPIVRYIAGTKEEK